MITSRRWATVLRHKYCRHAAYMTTEHYYYATLTDYCLSPSFQHTPITPRPPMFFMLTRLLSFNISRFTTFSKQRYIILATHTRRASCRR